MMRAALFCLAVVSAATTAAARTRDIDIETWLAADASPYAQAALEQLPRFRAQRIRIVTFEGGRPGVLTNALAAGLRDRLRETLRAGTAVRLVDGRQRFSPRGRLNWTNLDCTERDADYLVGIAVSQTAAGAFEANLKAFDTADRSWVAGFARQWTGPLSASQNRLFRTAAVDPAYRGERDAPWTDAEVDLLAAQLAYEIGCAVLRQSGHEYVLAQAGVGRGNELLDLVGKNLAGISYLGFAAADDSGNALIEGKAHRIDADLYQYWVTVRPLDATSGLSALSADAYVRIPDVYRAAALVPEETIQVTSGADRFLEPLQVVRVPGGRTCRAGSVGPGHRPMPVAFIPATDCYALQVLSRQDAIVFFLSHQLGHGLVRLGDGQCTALATARIARDGDPLRFTLPADLAGSGEWATAENWALNPAEDTYFAIASTNSRAARALSGHIARLPVRCGSPVRPGLDGNSLRSWLIDLQRITAHWKDAIDWRAVRVREIY